MIEKATQSGVVSNALVLIITAMAMAVVVVGLMTQISARREQRNQQSAVHQLELIRLLDHILSTTKDAETGQRGYILTGDRQYLEPYQDAVTTLGPELLSLRNSAQESPPLQEHAAEIEALTTAKISELADSIEAFQHGGPPAAMEIVLTGHGKRVMDRLREVVDQAEAEEGKRLNADVARAANESRINTVEVLIGLPITLCSMGFMVLFAFRAVEDSRAAFRSPVQSVGPRGMLARYSLALAVPCVALLLRGWISSSLGELPIFITLYPAVLLVTVFAGGVSGAIATVVSALAADYWLMKPSGTLGSKEASDLLAMAFFIFSNLGLCMLARRFQQAAWIEYHRVLTLLNGIKGFAIVLMNNSGSVVAWNQGGESLTGYSTAAIRGRTINVLLTDPASNGRDSGVDFDEARRMGKWVGQRLIYRADGTHFWAALNVTAIHGTRGETVGFGLVATDISDSKKAKDALAESAERYRLLVQDQRELMALVSFDGVIRFVNEAFARFVGCDAVSSVGNSIYAFVGKEDQGLARALMRRLIDGSASTDQAEMLMMAADGERRWVEWRSSIATSSANSAMKIHMVGRDVTEQRRAREELTKAHEQMTLAFQTAGLGFWTFDLGTQTVQWDDQMFKLYGLIRRPGAQPYDLWSSSLHPEDRAVSERALVSAIQGGNRFDTSFRIICPNGEIRHLRASAALIRDSGGAARSMYGVNMDITARSQADEQFRAAIEAAPTGMLMIDSEGKVVLVNKAIENIFGYEPETLLGKSIEELLPERFRGPHPNLRKRFLSHPIARLMGAGRDLYGLRRDGTEVPLEIGLSPLRTTAGQFILGSISDITERRRAAEVQQRMTALIDSTSDAVITIGLDGTVRTWNSAAEHLLGYSAAEIVGQSELRLIPLDRREEEAHFFEEIRSGKKIGNFETVRLRKNGSEIDVSLSVSPVFSDSGQLVLTSEILRDITQQRASAEALRHANAELETRVKMRTVELAEREAMLQEIHHRVKNNLQVISSLINMQLRVLTDESSRLALRDCRSRVLTMAEIHEMLYQSADYAQIPFAQFARTLTERIFSASVVSQGNVGLRFDLEDLSLPVHQAIPCGLILNELVANSLKHAFPRDRIGTLSVDFRQAPNREMLLTVSDDGVGLSPTVNLDTAGSLGVQLVTTLVEQLDGRLEIGGEPGSCFRIRFPLELAA